MKNITSKQINILKYYNTDLFFDFITNKKG